MRVVRHLLRWALPLSLALNIFFIVLTIRYHDFFRPRPADPGHVVALLRANLAPADAAILQQSFAARDMRPPRNDLLAERIRSALTASPFNGDLLRDAFKEGRASRDAFDQAMEDAFIDAAGKISPEGRAKLAAEQGRRPPPPRGAPPPPREAPPPPPPGFPPPPFDPLHPPPGPPPPPGSFPPH